MVSKCMSVMSSLYTKAETVRQELPLFGNAEVLEVSDHKRKSSHDMNGIETS
jgi:hypothetical protein